MLEFPAQQHCDMAAQGAQIVLGAVAFGKPKPTTRDVSSAPFSVPLPLAAPA